MPDAVVGEVDRCRGLGLRLGWRKLLETPVRPCGVEVPQVYGEDAAQVLLVDDQCSVEQLATETSDHSLTDSIHPRHPDTGEHDLDAGITQDPIEQGGVLPVPVANQIPDGGASTLQV